MIAPTETAASSFNALSRLGAVILAVAILVTGAAAFTVADSYASSSSPPELSLTFPTQEAQLSGSSASVWSTCQGPEALVCHGTLTLATSGNKHSAEFSVIAGTNQSLTVSLGRDSSAERVVATVRTAQANGHFVRSRTVLHLR